MGAAKSTRSPFVPAHGRFGPLVLSHSFLIGAALIGHLELLQAVLMMCGEVFLVTVSSFAYAPTPFALKSRLISIVKAVPVIFLIMIGMLIFVVHPAKSEQLSGLRLMSTLGDLLRDQGTTYGLENWAVYLVLNLGFPLVSAIRSGSARRWWFDNMIVPMQGTIWALLFASLFAPFLAAAFLHNETPVAPWLTALVLLFFAVLRAGTIWVIQSAQRNFEKAYRTFVAGFDGLP
jgi:hypothetical protein